ncbi:fatty acid binding protein 1-A, liver-like [Glandiceps talaboti]
MALASIVGGWQLDSHDNLEAFLDAMEVPAPAKAAALDAKPHIDVTVDGNNIHIKMSGPRGTIEQSLTLGEVFDMKNPITGEMRKAIATLEGSKLVVKPGAKYPKEPQSVYEVIGDKLVCTMSVDSVSCKRLFVKA